MSPAGYSGTPLWKKLGYRDGTSSYVAGARKDYVRMLQLPSDITVALGTARGPWNRICAFFHRVEVGFAEKALLPAEEDRGQRNRLDLLAEEKLQGRNRRHRGRRPEAALPLGFVDIKVCAVNETWSALKLMIRKELRPGVGRTGSGEK